MAGRTPGDGQQDSHPVHWQPMNAARSTQTTRRRQALSIGGLATVFAAWLGCSGCSQSTGPEMLAVPASSYAAAFDAAVEASRRHGLPAAYQDRRGGVIETAPRQAGSILEPWRTDNASLSQGVENTLGNQRRIARFEFRPVGFSAEPPQADGDATLAGPTVVGAEEQLPDLTQAQGELELRVWVYLERAQVPGLRRSTWTRNKTTATRLVVPEGENGLPTGEYWVPVSRDEAYERRLLAAVRERLDASPAARE